MKIKKNDTVMVITGKDKGKTGKVIRAFPRELKLIVEGINIRKRHQRPNREGKKGQILDIAHPIHVSNLKKTESEAPAKPKAKKAAAKTKKA